MPNEEAYDGDIEEEDSYIFKEYEITSSPNDFNINTIYNFIQSGIMEIPTFQRNYVWDIKRASKLIESLIIGLPIPQIFLFEEAKNKFLVIDGQQRLLTIFYFIKKRFPRKEKRVFIGKIFDKHNNIPEDILHDNNYFEDFNLKLPSDIPDQKNPLNGLNYSTLPKEIRTSFELRTIRNILIKQNSPPNDESSIYEIFKRLNSGGINLTSQEIRSSLYHSQFYEFLGKINEDPRWRKLFGKDEDLHQKDIESLLRGFAMLMTGWENYRPSMTRFLNNFCQKAQQFKPEEIQYLEKLFNNFLEACKNLEDHSFFSKTNKFNISMYEAIFTTMCEKAYTNKTETIPIIDKEKLLELKNDKEFTDSSQSETASTPKVKKRMQRAKFILLGKS